MVQRMSPTAWVVTATVVRSEPATCDVLIVGGSGLRQVRFSRAYRGGSGQGEP